MLKRLNKSVSTAYAAEKKTVIKPRKRPPLDEIFYKKDKPRTTASYYFSQIQQVIGPVLRWPECVRTLLLGSKLAYVDVLIIAVFGYINKVPIDLLCMYLNSKGLPLLRRDNVVKL